MSLQTYSHISQIPKNWDLIVIGGGITGAGVLSQGAGLGLRCLLLEQMDYSWGTSSRSAKLVHGGLRYLKQGKLFITWASVKERERLLRDGPGLIEEIGILIPVYKGRRPGFYSVSAGLTIYDLISGKKQRTRFTRNDFIEHAPHIKRNNLDGGFRFVDAQVDDSRLTIRLIEEAVANGCVALNYTRVEEIKRCALGKVVGVTAVDVDDGTSVELNADTVINATGAWAEKIDPHPNRKKKLRPLRGSHLVFPSDTLTLDDTISFNHPRDNRPLYICPWEGALIYGTTDVDHQDSLLTEPAITKHEIEYLMEALDEYFPQIQFTQDTCLSTFAGIRPVLGKGGKDPSKESRDYEVWDNKGLITVTGGKLTTFRRLAWKALSIAFPYMKKTLQVKWGEPTFRAPHDITLAHKDLLESTWIRLTGRYGSGAKTLVDMANSSDLDVIPGSKTIWAELPYIARHEQVRHLSDLLLRRVRIGLLLPKGGERYLPKIKGLCLGALGWTDERWNLEKTDYLRVWRHAHSDLNHDRDLIDEVHQ